MDLPSPLPYDIVRVKDLYYTFTNKDGIVYHLYFNPLSELYPQLPNTYSFSIEPQDSKPHPIDRRIAITVVSVLRKFFENIDNAMIMVCDSTDGKHHKRRNLFNRWFQYYNDGTITTRNAEVSDADYELLLSLYFKRNNPDKTQLIKSFNDLLTTNLYELVI